MASIRVRHSGLFSFIKLDELSLPMYRGIACLSSGVQFQDSGMSSFASAHSLNIDRDDPELTIHLVRGINGHIAVSFHRGSLLVVFDAVTSKFRLETPEQRKLDRFVFFQQNEYFPSLLAIQAKSSPVVDMVFQKANKSHDIRFLAIHANGSVPVWEWNKGPCKWNFIGRGNLSPPPQLFSPNCMPNLSKQSPPPTTTSPPAGFTTAIPPIHIPERKSPASLVSDSSTLQNNVTTSACCVDPSNSDCINIFWVDVQKHERRTVSVCTLLKSSAGSQTLDSENTVVIYDSQFEQYTSFSAHSFIDQLIVGKHGLFLIYTTFYPQSHPGGRLVSAIAAKRTSKRLPPELTNTLCPDHLFYYCFTTKTLSRVKIPALAANTAHGYGCTYVFSVHPITEEVLCADTCHCQMIVFHERNNSVTPELLCKLDFIDDQYLGPRKISDLDYEDQLNSKTIQMILFQQIVCLVTPATSQFFHINSGNMLCEANLPGAASQTLVHGVWHHGYGSGAIWSNESIWLIKSSPIPKQTAVLSSVDQKGPPSKTMLTASSLAASACQDWGASLRSYAAKHTLDHVIQIKNDGPIRYDFDSRSMPPPSRRLLNASSKYWLKTFIGHLKSIALVPALFADRPEFDTLIANEINAFFLKEKVESSNESAILDKELAPVLHTYLRILQQPSQIPQPSNLYVPPEAVDLKEELKYSASLEKSLTSLLRENREKCLQVLQKHLRIQTIRPDMKISEIKQLKPRLCLFQTSELASSLPSSPTASQVINNPDQPFPYFETMCRLYDELKPNVLPVFLQIVNELNPIKKPDDHRKYYQVAHRAVCPLESIMEKHPKYDARISSRYKILRGSGRFSEAVELLLTYKRYADVQRLCRTCCEPDSPLRTELFHYILNCWLKQPPRDHFDEEEKFYGVNSRQRESEMGNIDGGEAVLPSNANSTDIGGDCEECLRLRSLATKSSASSKTRLCSKCGSSSLLLDKMVIDLMPKKYTVFNFLEVLNRHLTEREPQPLNYPSLTKSLGSEIPTPDILKQPQMPDTPSTSSINYEFDELKHNRTPDSRGSRGGDVTLSPDSFSLHSDQEMSRHGSGFKQMHDATVTAGSRSDLVSVFATESDVSVGKIRHFLDLFHQKAAPSYAGICLDSTKKPLF